MNQKTEKPRWLAVFLVLPLMLILGWLETRLVLSETGHQLVQLGILALVFFLVYQWLNANESGLIRSEYVKKEWPVSQDATYSQANQALSEKENHETHVAH